MHPPQQSTRPTVGGRNHRGSILVAGVFFLSVLMLIAAFGVDLSRYFMRHSQMQEVADGAVLSAAQSLDQFQHEPNTEAAYTTALNYIEAHQGPGFRSTYTRYSDTNVEGVYVSRFAKDNGDSAYRIGVVVRDTFDPIFMPAALFGGDTKTIHVSAIAVAEPVFSHQYWKSKTSTGPNPIPPLRRAIYSEQHVKPEGMDCFQVEGDVHANDGYVKIEEMTGDGCGTGESVRITGNVEAGSVDTGSGNVTLENVSGAIEGDVVHEGSYTNQNGPTVESSVTHDDPGDLDLTEPPTPEENPSVYTHPICTFEADLTVDDFGTDLGDCTGGGTIYVKGNLKISGTNMQGNYSFVGEGEVKFEETPDLTSRDMFVYSINENVKFENVDDAEINATIYAPNSEVKWETSSDVTINGGIVAGAMAKLETTGYMRVNYRNHAELMPDNIVQPGTNPEPIADYYTVYLVD